jgi:ABC-type lipoprotein release transport system permease subunit
VGSQRAGVPSPTSEVQECCRRPDGESARARSDPWAARGVLTGILFDLSPTDPLTVSGAAIAILLLASLAAYVPARRASRIDPVAAVRYE